MFGTGETTSQLADDTPVQTPLQLACGVTSLAFSNQALYGFASCAGVLRWPADVVDGLTGSFVVMTPASLGLVGVGDVLMGLFPMLPVERSKLLSLSYVGAVGSHASTAYLMHIDVVNGLTWRCDVDLEPSLSGSSLARVLARNASAVAAYVPAVHMTVGGMAGMAGVWAIGTRENSRLRVSAGWRACGLDMVSYDQVTCEAMQCVRLVNTRMLSRALGNRTYTCNAGYQDVRGGGCSLCRVGQYCTGGVAQACANSETTLTEGASSAAQCVCKPGYYTTGLLLTHCLPCSANAWCMGGSSYPIGCANGGLASGTSLSSSPLACRCPSATTFGLRCYACGSQSECFARADVTHTLRVLAVSGWGITASATAGLHVCLASLSSDWVVYVVPELAPLYNVFLGNEELATISISNNIFPLGWMVVVLDMNTTLGNAAASLQRCLEMGGATSLTNVSIKQTVSGGGLIAERTPCGIHVEADASGMCALCVEGYEAVYVQQYLTCAPCKVGTVRVAGSLSGCVGCRDNNSYAPSMGMSACVCNGGFYQLNDSFSVGTSCVAAPGRSYALSFFSTPLYLGLVVSSGLTLVLALCYMLSVCFVSN